MNVLKYLVAHKSQPPHPTYRSRVQLPADADDLRLDPELEVGGGVVGVADADQPGVGEYPAVAVVLFVVRDHVDPELVVVLGGARVAPVRVAELPGDAGLEEISEIVL